MFWLIMLTTSAARSLRLPARLRHSRISKFPLSCGARFFCNAEAEKLSLLPPRSHVIDREHPSTTLIPTTHIYTQWLLKCNL